ncbi:MAG: response regulator transcription factor [Candidatus Obscuribacterales bacterium]|jgi:DNA-binding response OmpR family regulator
MSRILIVEDDEQLLETLSDGLSSYNHVVEAVAVGSDGLERLLASEYDLAILDWGLPVLSGLEICQEYRQKGGQAPIIFLTGKRDIDSRVGALDMGADDYLTKPFSFKELLARVNALLRRPSHMAESVLTVQNVKLDLGTRAVTIDDKPISLAANEYALLELLLRNRGKVFSYNELMERIFKADEDASEEAVRQRITRLRKKIDGDREVSCIRTIKGLGYCIDVVR